MGTQYCFFYNLRHFHTQAMHIASSVRVQYRVVKCRIVIESQFYR